MAQLLTIKTTSDNANLGFPKLSLYVNQKCFDTYKNSGGQMLFNQTFDGYTGTPIFETLKDDGTLLNMPVYYNNYFEYVVTTASPLTQLLNLFCKPVLKYSGTTQTGSLTYNNRNYGTIYTGDVSLPSPLPTGLNRSSYLSLGGSGSSIQDTYFGSYYISYNIASNTGGYYGTDLTLNLTVFSEDILNENNLIDITGKCVIFRIILSDNMFTSNGFTIRIDCAGVYNVSSLINASMFSGVKPTLDTGNPYDNSPGSDTGGGNGTFDYTSDTINIPSMPLLSSLDTGFVKIWQPTTAQLQQINSYLWSSAFDENTFKKIFANPIDTIMGFGIIPVALTANIAKEFKVGNIGTGIYVNAVSEQYYDIDCGTMTFEELFGSYLDYEPYSSYDIYLPYIGSVRISPDDIKKNAPGTLQIIYRVDILSGSCVCWLLCNGSVAYQYNGNVLTQLPITGNDFRGMFQSILGIAGNLVSGVNSFVQGNPAGVLGNVASAAGNAMGIKPSINRSGSISSAVGALSIKKPYIIANVPIISKPENQNIYTGFPSNITRTVKNLHGFTIFDKIYLENIPATDNELTELKTLLESGVVL